MRRRLLYLVASPIALAVSFVIAWGLLPFPRIFICPAPCGGNSGAVDVFGSGKFTLAQTMVMAAGIWLSMLFLALAALPTRLLLCAGFGVLVLAFAIGFTLPSPVVGPEPSVVCYTPDGGGGQVAGRCSTGPAPTDTRIGLRLLVAGGGILVLGLSGAVDAAWRRRRRGDGPISISPAPATT
jgi:hypothetical protein